MYFCFLQVDCELLIEVTYKKHNYYAIYKTFKISSEEDNYRLTIGQYEGTTGDAMSYHNGMVFSTMDRYNDLAENGRSRSCVQDYQGGWWYNDCAFVNLNGQWELTRSNISGLFWLNLTGKYDVLSFSEMKIRPKQKMRTTTN